MIRYTVTWSVRSLYVRASVCERAHFTDYITVAFHFTLFSYHSHFQRSFVFFPFLFFFFSLSLHTAMRQVDYVYDIIAYILTTNYVLVWFVLSRINMWMPLVLFSWIFSHRHSFLTHTTADQRKSLAYLFMTNGVVLPAVTFVSLSLIIFYSFMHLVFIFKWSLIIKTGLNVN